jgi:hypothetical protein
MSEGALVRVSIGRYKTAGMNQAEASKNFSLSFVTGPSGVSSPRTT